MILGWLLAFAYSLQSLTAGTTALGFLETHLAVKLLVLDCKLEFNLAITALEHTIFELGLLLTHDVNPNLSWRGAKVSVRNSCLKICAGCYTSSMLQKTKVLVRPAVPQWWRLLTNIANFVRSLQYLTYTVDSDGTVTVEHINTGTFVRYRADGNLDVYSARNFYQRTKEHILLNCSDNFDRLTPVERHLHAERHSEA